MGVHNYSVSPLRVCDFKRTLAKEEKSQEYDEDNQLQNNQQQFLASHLVSLLCKVRPVKVIG